MDAMLTADSPQRLIEQLSVQRVMAAEMSAQMQQLPHGQRARVGGRGGLRQVGRRRQDRGGAGRRGARRPAVEAEPAAGADRRGQVPVPGADAEPARSACRSSAVHRLRLKRPRLPPDDPAILAAPPGGIPPGDIAPPEGAVAPEAAPGEGVAAVQAALTRVGSPYSWGGSGPEPVRLLRPGDVGVPAGGHLAAALQPGAGPRRPAGGRCDQMQPGDLVTYYSDASHAAIYIGDGMMVHASTYGTPVRVAPMDNAPIHNVRRY